MQLTDARASRHFSPEIHCALASFPEHCRSRVAIDSSLDISNQPCPCEKADWKAAQVTISLELEEALYVLCLRDKLTVQPLGIFAEVRANENDLP